MDTLHNNPPKSSELYREHLDELKQRIDAFGGVNEDNAGAARDLIGLAKELAKDVEKTRKKEKEPHLEAGRIVDGVYNPIIKDAKAATAGLEKALTAHIREQQRIAHEREEAARRKAEEEAERARQLADDALIGDEVAEKAQKAQADAEVAAAAVDVAKNVKGSEGFRAVGIRVTKKAKVSNSVMLVTHYMQHPDVIALCERLANADIRAAKGGAVQIPGVEIVEVESLV